MKSINLAISVVVLLLVLTACNEAQQTSNTINSIEEENRRIALEFYRAGITTEERAAMISEDYIQHNPAALQFAQELGVGNKEAFPLWMAKLQAGAASRPKPTGPVAPSGDPVHMVLVENDLVFIMHQVFSQDPNKPAGNFYEHFTWGVFRITDGKISEHWDGNTIGAE